MQPLQADQFVVLTRGIPEYGLLPGAVGVVRTRRFLPMVSYDVEFYPPQGERIELTLEEDALDPTPLGLFMPRPMAAKASIPDGPV